RWLFKQKFGEHHTHSPPSGESPKWLIEISRLETNSFQYFLRLSFNSITFVCFKSFLKKCQSIYNLIRIVGFHFLQDFIDLILQSQCFLESCQGYIQNTVVRLVRKQILI